MITRIWNYLPHKIILALAVMAVIAGCAGLEGQGKSAAVPEIHPGILAGYLDPETLPNSLVLIPPPPAEDSAALALDEEVSRNSLALRGTL
jgi:acid phosphatase (class A)